MNKEVEYTIVGFRIDQSRSVFYRKVEGIQRLLLMVRKAFLDHNAQFISIRRIEG